MRETQRLIKYAAMAFAVFLVFNIVTSIMFGVMTLSNFFDDDTTSDKLKALDLSSEAAILNIDLTSSNVIIKEGNTFKIETDSAYIKSRQQDNQIYIEEEDHNWFFNTDKEDLIVYVPKGFMFDAISIDVKTGKINIDELHTKKLFLEQGAGKMNIAYLEVSEAAEIRGGAGKVVIKDGVVNQLNLKIGAGKLSLTAKITGNSKVEAGLGKLDLVLLGQADDYKIEVEQGLGSIDINGLERNNEYYGKGNNFISLDGGIGSIDVQLKSNK